MMPLHVDTTTLAIGGSIILAVGFYIWSNIRRVWSLSLPPGPRGLPFLGNVFDMPVEKPWLTFKRWADDYGDVIHIQLPFQPTIIIGSSRAALDLLEKRSSIYSDRPWATMDEISGSEWDFSMLPYGPQWREKRRCFHQYFNQGVIEKYQPVQKREIRAFLRRLLTDNFSLASARQMTAAIIIGICYGKLIHSMDDEYIQIASAANEGFNQMKNSPGAFWMDYFPILKYIPAWVPGATGRKLAEQHVPITRMMRDQPFYSAKNDILNGSATPSIVYNIIDRLQSQFSDSKSYTAEEEMARDVLALAYSAGLDTSLITTLVFFVAMAMYPDVQKKAQGELDRVLGSGRLPTFEDRDSLPYIEAIILESIRWMPAVPLGVSHRVLTEDLYKGYRISKGSVIIPNAWAMLHNPDDYPCPEQFNPDRFIKDSSLDREVLDPSVIAFGFGRRVCPGRYLAKDTLYLTLASILCVYEILPAIDKMGKPVQLSAQQTTGFLSYPETLDCMVKPRSTLATQLILESDSFQ